VVALSVLVAVALGPPSPAWPASPTSILGSFFERANAILRSADLTTGIEEPRRAIRTLARSMFDFREAAALALGPAWTTRTPSEQEEFVRLFADLLERGYLAMIGSKARVAGGVSVEYVAELVEGDLATVSTRVLTRSGENINVDYRMVRRSDRWAVRDVIIDGVSLVANYRAQFTRVLTAVPYADLVSRMRRDAPKPQPEVVAAALAPLAGPPAEDDPATPRAVRVATAPAVPPPPPASPPPAAPAIAASTVSMVPARMIEGPAAKAPAASVTAPPKTSDAQPSIKPAPVAPAVRMADAPAAPKPPATASRLFAPAGPAPSTTAKATDRPASPPRVASAAVQKKIAPSRPGYWVQVGAFRTSTAAMQMAEGLRRLSMPVAISPIQGSRGVLNRVRVGPYESQGEASAKLRELEAKGYGAFVTPTDD
jgi:phospholipid transport system substrate-binding protein